MVDHIDDWTSILRATLLDLTESGPLVIERSWVSRPSTDDELAEATDWAFVEPCYPVPVSPLRDLLGCTPEPATVDAAFRALTARSYRHWEAVRLACGLDDGQPLVDSKVALHVDGTLADLDALLAEARVILTNALRAR